MNYIKTKLEDRVLWITLSNIKKGNAFCLQMISSLVSCLNDAKKDKQVSIIVITGEGKYFSSGGDIKAMQNKEEMFAGTSDELRCLYQEGIQKIPQTIESLNKPIIAMVNGAAVGAGFDLSSMCDLRIASDKASFAVTFSKLGLISGDGGAFFLIRAVGYAKAMEMFLTADFYSANDAYKMGFVNKLYPHDKLEEKTREFSKKIIEGSSMSISMIKSSLKQAYSDANLQSHLDFMAAYQAIAQRDDDHFKRLSTFLNKHPTKI